MSLAARLGAFAAAPFAGLVPALALVQPQPGRAVAIVHTTAAAPSVIGAIGAAGGLVLAAASPHVTFAFPREDGFAGRLQHAGPWLVLDAAAASGCLGTPPGPEAVPRDSGDPGIPARPGPVPKTAT